MAAKTLSAVALLSALSGVDAFWRMQCKGQTGLALMDPIDDFGKPASHIHSLHGGSGLSMTSTYDDMRDSNCSSCAVGEDMSGYWFPNMWFQDDATGKFEEVPNVGGLLAYYLQRNSESPTNKVRAFPPGFRMIAGDKYRRDYTLGNVRTPDPPTSNWESLGQTSQKDLVQRAVGFNCLNYAGPAEPSLFRHYLPEKSMTDAQCPDGIRVEMMFPSCWNGKDLDSDDHRSHVAYPNLVGDGTCPEGYDERLVTLFFESIWDVGNSKFAGRSGRWVMANGDPTGFGNHADFLTGWDEEYLQSALDKCTNESGELEDCSVFMEDGLQTEEEQTSCFLSETLDAEVNLMSRVGDALSILPGPAPIYEGPEPAPQHGGGSAPAPTSSSSTPPSPTGDVMDPVESVVDGIVGGGHGGAGDQTLDPTTEPTQPSTSSTPAAATASQVQPDGGAFIEDTPTTTSTTSSPPPTTTPPPPPVTSDPGVSYELVSTQTIDKEGYVQEIVWMRPVVYVTQDVTTTTTEAAQPARRNHLARHNHGHGHQR